MSMTHDEMIEVIQAHKEGRAIEWSDLDCEGWGEFSPAADCWDFTRYEYRIKPEPPKRATARLDPRSEIGGYESLAHNRDGGVEAREVRPGDLTREEVEERIKHNFPDDPHVRRIFLGEGDQ